jgi:hypothetical protein
MNTKLNLGYKNSIIHYQKPNRRWGYGIPDLRNVHLAHQYHMIYFDELAIPTYKNIFLNLGIDDPWIKGFASGLKEHGLELTQNYSSDPTKIGSLILPEQHNDWLVSPFNELYSIDDNRGGYHESVEHIGEIFRQPGGVIRIQNAFRLHHFNDFVPNIIEIHDIFDQWQELNKIYRARCPPLLDRIDDAYLIFTDGAKFKLDEFSSEKITMAAVWIREDSDSNLNVVLPKNASAYQAELTAIRLALEIAPDRNIRIISDSLAAIGAIENQQKPLYRKSHAYLIQQCHELIDGRSKRPPPSIMSSATS